MKFIREKASNFVYLCYWLIEVTNAAEHYEIDFDLYRANFSFLHTKTSVRKGVSESSNSLGIEILSIKKLKRYYVYSSREIFYFQSYQNNYFLAAFLDVLQHWYVFK